MSSRESKDENRKIIENLVDFLWDESEEEPLTEGEIERGKDFVANMEARFAEVKRAQKTSWVDEARAELTAVKRNLTDIDFNAEPEEMREYLRTKKIAARGLKRGLDELEEDELRELYREQLKAERLDDL